VPPPAKTRKMNAKQYKTASSPPLVIGMTPVGRCWVKKAKAITPDATNAAMRVNNPTVIRIEAISSRIPA